MKPSRLFALLFVSFIMPFSLIFVKTVNFKKVFEQFANKVIMKYIENAFLREYNQPLSLKESQTDILLMALSKEYERDGLPNADDFDLNLCSSSEDISYSFQFIDSDEILTIATSKKHDYIVCRIGTKDEIKFEYPKNKVNSWGNFNYRYYLREGRVWSKNNPVLCNYLIFETDIFIYEIFREYNPIKNELRIGLTQKHITP